MSLYLVYSVPSEILVDSVLDIVTLFRSPNLILFKEKNLGCLSRMCNAFTDKHLQENLRPDKTVIYHQGEQERAT